MGASALLLAVRGALFRLPATVATLVVAVLAIGAAALGPVYSATAQDSLVRHGLATAPLYRTGLVGNATVAGSALQPVALVGATVDAVAAPRYDPLFAATTVSATASRVGVSPPGGGAGYEADVSWRRGMCASVRLVAGRCPGTAGTGRQAMVSARALRSLGLALNRRLDLSMGSTAPNGNAPVVVGVYDQDSATAPGWVFDSPDRAGPPDSPDGPPRLDEVLVDESTVLDAGVGTRVTAFRPLRSGIVHARLLPLLTRLGQPVAVGDVAISSGAPDLAAALQADRVLVRASATAVAVQAAVLALFVLYLVLAATAEERGPEVALAKLRGMTSGATLAFSVLEPVVLLVLAVPLGVAGAWGLDVLLARGLYPGSEARVTGAALVAAAIGLGGGLAATLLAVRRLLATPVLGQLRRTGGHRAALARSLALDTGAVALAVAGVYELRSGSSDLVGLATPGLVALAAGLLVVRLVPPLARLAVARTRRSTRVAPFLAVRAVARRPAAARLVVLLAVAVALAVFGVDGDLVARGVRSDTARAGVGAEEVVHVRADSPGVLLAAVRAADPGGRSALAAVEATGSTSVDLIAVDTPRLAAVSAWDPTWVGTTAPALAGALHPATDPVPVRGSVSARWSYPEPPKGGAAEVDASLDVALQTGRRVTVGLGRLRPGGSGAVRAALPEVCRSAGCRLLGWRFDPDLTTVPAPAAGDPTGLPDGSGPSVTLTLSDPADADGALHVPTPAPGSARWHYQLGSLDVLDPTRSPAVTVADVGAAGFAVSLDVGSTAQFRVAPAGVVTSVPVLLSTALPAGQLLRPPDGATTLEDLAGAPALFVPVPGSGELPRVGANGAMADLETLSLLAPQQAFTADDQVWFAPDADVAGVLARLADAGIRPVNPGDVVVPTPVETIPARLADLAASGPALGLRLFVAAAAAAVVLALGALLTAAFVAARRRSYEVAAVVALGGRRAVLVRASAAEQLALVALGVAIGIASGAVAARLALPVLGSVTSGGPVAPALVVWWAVAAVGAVVLAVAALVALAAARRLVRLGDPDRLREVQG